RKSVNPGIALSASSMVAGPLDSSSLDDMTVTVEVGSERAISVRDDGTLTASKNGAGCSVTSTVRAPAGTLVWDGANPGAVTRTSRAPSALMVTSKRPSASVRVSPETLPAICTRTAASATDAPDGSITFPLKVSADCAAAGAVVNTNAAAMKGASIFMALRRQQGPRGRDRLESSSRPDEMRCR